jgi:hypothetical protein
VRPTAVHVLLLSGILLRIQAALPHVTPLVAVPVLFLPSPDERRIRTTGTEGEQSHSWPQLATCFGNPIASVWFYLSVCERIA